MRQQIYLGGDAFITRMQAQSGAGAEATRWTVPANVSKIQASAPPLDGSIKRFVTPAAMENKASRNQAMVDAFRIGGHSQTAIAEAFGVSGSTVSRVIKDQL